jgi:hypothetical protein
MRKWLNGGEVIWCLYLICDSISWFFSSHLHGCTCRHWKSGVFINFQFRKSWFDHKDVTLFWKPETRNPVSGFRFHPYHKEGPKGHIYWRFLFVVNRQGWSNFTPWKVRQISVISQRGKGTGGCFSRTAKWKFSSMHSYLLDRKSVV